MQDRKTTSQATIWKKKNAHHYSNQYELYLCWAENIKKRKFYILNFSILLTTACCCLLTFKNKPYSTHFMWTITIYLTFGCWWLWLLNPLLEKRSEIASPYLRRRSPLGCSIAAYICRRCLRMMQYSYVPRSPSFMAILKQGEKEET